MEQKRELPCGHVARQARHDDWCLECERLEALEEAWMVEREAQFRAWLAQDGV